MRVIVAKTNHFNVRNCSLPVSFVTQPLSNVTCNLRQGEKQAVLVMKSAIIKLAHKKAPINEWLIGAFLFYLTRSILSMYFYTMNITCYEHYLVLRGGRPVCCVWKLPLLTFFLLFLPTAFLPAAPLADTLLFNEPLLRFTESLPTRLFFLRAD